MQQDMTGGTERPGTEAHEGLAALADVRAAAMRPVLNTPRWWWPSVGVLAAVVVLGVVTWVVQVKDGLGVAGYNNTAFWAVYEADLVAFIGVSYGGAVVSAILRITRATWRAPLTRIAEATALVTLPIGMLFIVPHLGSPWRIWELAWPPYWNLSSPILWDFFAVSTYLLATVVFFYLPGARPPPGARGGQGSGRRAGRARGAPVAEYPIDDPGESRLCTSGQTGTPGGLVRDAGKLLPIISQCRAKRACERRYREVANELSSIGYIASGSLARRSHVCGKPNCACQADPPRPHGP